MTVLNADLHCHSTVSDGTLSPEALAERAPEPSGGVGERGPDPAPYVEVASPLLELTAP